MSTIREHAIFVVNTEEAVAGFFLKGVCVPVQVSEGVAGSEWHYLASGDELKLEDVQGAAKLGDLARVREEALGQSTFYVAATVFASKPDEPFWLFPIKGLEVKSARVTVKIGNFNFFKSAGLQLAS